MGQLCAGRNGRGRVLGVSPTKTIDFEETDVSRTRPQPFLPEVTGTGAGVRADDRRRFLFFPACRARLPRKPEMDAEQSLSTECLAAQ
eukprot:gene13785-biopygen3545